MKKENKLQAKKKKQKQLKRARISKGIRTALWVAIPVIVVGIIVFLIVNGEVKSHYSFSDGLNDDGTIKGVNVEDYVTLGDYSNMTAKRSELVTEEEIEKQIQADLDANKVLNKESTNTIADKDKVSIDFKGMVDNEEFEGGTSTDYEVEIGSGTLIDDFEQQLIGHKVGDEFNVEVTFPNDYASNRSLEGKDAVFAVTIKGIYEAPELTDEYVKEKHSDVASTVEEYRKYVEETIYKSNLEQFAEDYVRDASKVTVPKNYYKALKHVYEANYEEEFNYYNQMYYSYFGTYMWKDKYDYFGKTKEEFEQMVEDAVNDTAEFSLVTQAVYEKEGLSIKDSDVDDFIKEFSDYGNTEDAVKDYGRGYWVQGTKSKAAIEYLASLVKVEE